jgi:hypothetical protein
MRDWRGRNMRIVIFGSSGMVGQGALRECLRDPEVQHVVSIVPAPTGTTHEKLREIVHNNFLNFAPIENELSGHSACLYYLGVKSTGTSEENHTRITYEFTNAAATTLLKLNPGMSRPSSGRLRVNHPKLSHSPWRKTPAWVRIPNRVCVPTRSAVSSAFLPMIPSFLNSRSRQSCAS